MNPLARAFIAEIKTDLSSFSPPVRRYFAYHALISPILVFHVLIPFYLFLIGMTLVEVAILSGIVMTLEIVLPALLGHYLDRVGPTRAIAFAHLLDALGFTCLAILPSPDQYGLILIGLILIRAEGVFTPAYAAYEHAIFAKELVAKTRAYHLAIPEISQGITFLVVGVWLGVLAPDPAAIRLGFAMAALLWLLTIWFPMYFFADIRAVWKPTTLNLAWRLPKLTDWSALVVLCDLLMVAGFAFVPTVIWADLLLTRQGTLFHYSLIEIGISIAVILGSLILRLLKFRNLLIVSLWGIGFISISSGVVLMSSSIEALLAASLAFAVGTTLWDPLHTEYLYSAIPEEYRGRALGTIETLRRVVSVGAMYAIAALGSSVQAYTVALIFWLIAAALYWVVNQQRMNRKTMDSPTAHPN